VSSTQDGIRADHTEHEQADVRGNGRGATIAGATIAGATIAGATVAGGAVQGFPGTRLAAIAGALAEATGIDDVASALLERGMTATGAFAGAIALLNEEGTHLELAASVGYDPALLDGWDLFPLEGSNPISDAVRENRTMLIPSTDALLQRYPDLQAFAERPHALAVFPVAAAGRILGGVALRLEVNANGKGNGTGTGRAPAVRARSESEEIIAALRERVGQLQGALDSRVIIEQAKGVLAERHGEPVEEAFERLRGAARSRSARIQEVAKAVVAGELEL
jgi:hypothetical protein